MSTSTVRTPQYQKLTLLLLAQITDGTLAVGDLLPTEGELCASHELSRGTVRKALDRLEQLGMISRRPGWGTTVISPTPTQGYQPLAQSATDIAAFAADTRIRHPETGEVKLTASLARRLGARPGTTWAFIRGVRTQRPRGATPLCWSEHYLRADLPTEKLFTGDFSAEEVARMTVQQTISAALLDASLAHVLDAEPDTAALVITRRHRDPRGRLVSIGIHTHPADRYQITTTI